MKSLFLLREAPRSDDGSVDLLYVFDGSVLDTDRRELYRDGIMVDIEPQVFDLLEYLLRYRERVVSRDELIEQIWGGRLVSESALSTRINAVRNAIGDSGSEQRLVKTLPRKGICFVGEVQEEQKSPEQTPVCTENLVRVDGVMESLSWPDDRASRFRAGRPGLAVLVEVAARG